MKIRNMDCRTALILACLGVLTLFPGSAIAQRNLKDIPNPDPELERKTLQLADGFEINLFAADPILAKPIQMNFDPQGRLWIASSETYPHIKPGEVAKDKVIVLEDKDGDGKAETTRVFADGLLIPTGIEPGDGGVYVANSTELLHLSDTDGDGKADKTRVVLSGFGTEDTHHILHTLRWGPEGLLYFNQSIYIHSHIETPHGVRRLNAGGIWQFRPETMRLDVYARGWVNSWGHHFDAWGQSFVTDGAGGQGINYGVPGASYQTAYGAKRLLPGLNPGSPKHCGLEVVSGRHLPEEWQGSILTNDFRGHRVCRFVLTDEGAGYVSRQQPELIKTNHVAFRPIDIKMGPDGAIYIADWYNPIIQHGEVDFRDTRRDHTHGRIWRVTYKGRPVLKRPQLVGAKVEDLVAKLTSPEEWTRRNAKRVIKERYDASALHPMSSKPDNDGLRPHERITQSLDLVQQLYANPEPHEEQHLLEILWTNQAIRRPQPQLLSQLLNATDFRVRAAATRVIGHWYEDIRNPLELLAKRVADEHPRVRLEAVRVLGQVPQARGVEIAMRALEQPVDAWLDYALWLTARETQQHWLPALQAGKLSFGGSADQLTFAVKSIGSPTVVAPLIQLVKDRKVAADRQAEVLGVIASIGGPGELDFVGSRALENGIAKPDRATILASLESAAVTRNVRPAGAQVLAARLMASSDVEVQASAARLVGLWKIEAQRDAVEKLAEDDKQPTHLRIAAIAGLQGLGGSPSACAIPELIHANDAAVSLAAMRAFIAMDKTAAVSDAVTFLKTADIVRAEAIFAQFLENKSGAPVLAKALNGKTLPADVAKVGLRAVSASGRNYAGLIAALTKAGGISSGPKQLSPAEMAAMVEAVQTNGNAVIGERVFRRADLNCLKCHAIGGAGGRVGPDMISLGSSAQVDYIVDALLIPSKAMKEGYQTVVVETLRGRVHTGIKLRQTKDELFLRTIEDQEITIPVKSIEEQVNGTSMMPVGLTDKLTQDEFVHLVRFLSELGKVGGQSIGGNIVARRWRIMKDTPEAAFRLRRTSYDTAATEDPAYTWLPAYSTVAGSLPVEELPKLTVQGRPNKVAFARCDFEVTTAGEFNFQFGKTKGLTMWLDGKPAELADNIVVELANGSHSLTFAVDGGRSEDLKVQLKGGTGVGRFGIGK